MDCSLPDSSVHGIFQAKVLEWGCHHLLRTIRTITCLISHGESTHYPETPQIGHGLPESTSIINKSKLNEVFGTNNHTFNLTLQNVSTFWASETDY